jgi:diketogulonate reductase-like aldo/keto reductase
MKEYASEMPAVNQIELSPFNQVSPPLQELFPY